MINCYVDAFNPLKCKFSNLLRRTTTYHNFTAEAKQDYSIFKKINLKFSFFFFFNSILFAFTLPIILTHKTRSDVYTVAVNVAGSLLPPLINKSTTIIYRKTRNSPRNNIQKIRGEAKMRFSHQINFDLLKFY